MEFRSVGREPRRADASSVRQREALHLRDDARTRRPGLRGPMLMTTPSTLSAGADRNGEWD